MNDAQRRLRQRLEALRSAGIEWVPRSALVPRTVAAPPDFPPASETTMPTSFEDDAHARPTAALSPDQRRQSLALLADEVSRCARCAELCSTRTQTVFGAGPIDVEVCCIGEAPGADEDKQGEPFVGAAGQLLTKILLASGFKREEVYICNVIKCRPPGNRTPKPEECDNCRPFLDKQLELVRPRHIICFGGTPATNLLGVKAAIGKLRGRFHDYKGIPVLVTYHPAYLLPHRNPAAKKDVWDDMKMLLKKMGRPIPATGGQ